MQEVCARVMSAVNIGVAAGGFGVADLWGAAAARDMTGLRRNVCIAKTGEQFLPVDVLCGRREQGARVVREYMVRRCTGREHDDFAGRWVGR